MMSQSPNESGDTPALRVVKAVADTKDVDPITLQPHLATTVDPDALNAMLTADASTAVTIRFHYANCHVEVSRDADVVVEILQRTDD